MSNDVSSVGNYGGVPNQMIVEYGHIGSASSNIYQYNSSLLLFFAEHCFGRGNWFKDNVFDFQLTSLYTLFNIQNITHLPCYDMKIGFHFLACHSNRIFNVRLIVYNVLLGNNRYNLFTGIHLHFIHVLNEIVDVQLRNLSVFSASSRIHSSRLQAFDMLTCNTHINIFYGGLTLFTF